MKFTYVVRDTFNEYLVAVFTDVNDAGIYTINWPIGRMTVYKVPLDPPLPDQAEKITVCPKCGAMG